VLDADLGNWWSATDGQILECLKAHGPMKLEALCDELHLSAGEASAFLAMLTREGRVKIREVELVS
jgi:predicted ArsR family transcriptional regulator